MKQVKIWAAALVVLMGAMFTSCMDGETNTIESNIVPMRVKSGAMGLTSFISGGLEVVPATTASGVDMSKLYGTNVALVYYRYDRALQEITAATKQVNVEILAQPEDIDAELSLCPEKEGSADVKATHAVISLSISNGYYPITPYIMPVAEDMVYPGSPAEYFVIVPISFNIVSVSKQEEWDTEMAKHSFTIVCYEEDIKEDDTALILHMRHVIDEEVTEGKPVERTQLDGGYRAYNLTQALATFKAKSGKMPTTITIKAMENKSSDALAGNETAEKKYEISSLNFE